LKIPPSAKGIEQSGKSGHSDQTISIKRNKNPIDRELGQTMLDNLGQTREDLDDVETLNNARDDIESANRDDLDSEKDDLMYSAGTGTLGNSSLNFGFSSGNKTFLQNNLSSKASKMNQ
jgi:hypothetical protein